MDSLIPVTDQKAIEAIFLSKGLQKAIDAIKEDALNYVADVSTLTGRKDCISKAAGIAKQKVIIDNAGKDLKADYKKKCDEIDTVRKFVRDTLDEVRDKVRKPVTDWEAAEEARIQAEREAVELEMAMEEAIAENKIFDREREIARKEAEFLRIEQEKAEKEQAEREEKERKEYEARIEREAKERAEREAAEAIEAEKRAKIEAELKAKQAAEQAEREKKEALERAEKEKQEAIEKAKREEQERQLKIQREKEERERKEKEIADKKAANIAHQRKINREALEGLTAIPGIDSELGKNIITAIVSGKVKHITVNY